MHSGVGGVTEPDVVLTQKCLIPRPLSEGRISVWQELIVGLMHDNATGGEQLECDERDASGDNHGYNVESEALD
jgi:hypothetical protein